MYRGATMGWKASGQPTVRQQRDKWVVRVDSIDTETGRTRPRQLGTVMRASGSVHVIHRDNKKYTRTTELSTHFNSPDRETPE
jgi:hypothetical protein